MLVKALVLILIVSACLCFGACDDDNGGFKPVNKFRDLTSPENVLFNFETAYNEMDYDHFRPLIRDDYLFFFAEDDLGMPGVPWAGLWGKSEELQTHHNMLDTAYVPQDDPQLEIDKLSLELAVSGELQPCPLEGAPQGTVEGFVTFDWFVSTVGDIDYYVQSRPRFYFTPDSTKTPVTWSIWRIEDAPFGQPSQATGSLPGASSDLPRSNSAVRSTDQARLRPAVEQKSWGAVKSLYL
jgi:hypothetical protein